MRSAALAASCAAVISLIVSACSNEGTPWTWTLPPGFPAPAVPADNPLTVEKAELGRHLFYDRRLSGNGTQACADCHLQALAFSDPKQKAIGSTGEAHRRNSMSLVNVAYNSTFTWAHSGLDSLEQQMLIPLFGDNPTEMGAGEHIEEILQRLSADARYPELFADAYASQRNPISFDNIVSSIASFERTLVSFGSAFDRYAWYGEDDAMTASQLRGMDLFMSERLECDHCHAGFNFSQFVTHESRTAEDRRFHVTGLYNFGERFADELDRGLAEVTGNAEDIDRFKAPTLRNVARTAPYMHDGSIATLSEVIDFYAAGGRNINSGPLRGDGRAHPAKNPFVRAFEITAEEKQDLLNFLDALTDEEFLRDPRFSNPFKQAKADAQ